MTDPYGLNSSWVRGRIEHLNQQLTAAKTEIERLRAELTTTLVACERCGRGVPPKYGVPSGRTEHFFCADCAKRELKRLARMWHEEHARGGRLEADRDHWRTEAERYQAALDDVQCRLYGGSD